MAATPFCRTCCDSRCDAATTATAFSPDHQRELDHEAADPAYAALKRAVIDAGDAVVLAMSKGVRASFMATMRTHTEELGRIRSAALAAEPILERFLRDDDNGKSANDVTSSPSEIQAALLRVRSAVSTRRKAFDAEQTGGSGNGAGGGADAAAEAQQTPEEREKAAAVTAYGAARDRAKEHVTTRNSNNNAAGGTTFPFPWRLGYYVELKQSFDDQQKQAAAAATSADASVPSNAAAAASVVNFEGGMITDANGDPLWDVVCRYCGLRIQQGAFGEGVPRVVRLNGDKQHCACVPCFDMLRRIHARVPATLQAQSANAAADDDGEDETDNTEKNGDDRAITFEPFDPAMDVIETEEPSLMRVASSKIASTHHIGHWLVKTLQVYAQRPALGCRTSSFASSAPQEQRQPSGKSAEGDADEDFKWITYRQLHVAIARLSNLLCDVRNGDEDVVTEARAFIGISSQNRWEFVAADMAAALSGWISIGIHTTYTEEELADVMRHVRLPVMVCDAAQLERFIKVGYEVAADTTAARQQLRLILCMDTLLASGSSSSSSSSFSSDALAALHAKHKKNAQQATIRVVSLVDTGVFSNLGGDSMTAAAVAPPPLKSPLMHPDQRVWDNTLVAANNATKKADVGAATVNNKNDGGDDADDDSALEGDSNLFSCIFTSGSSGSPKGVLHTERSFASDCGHALNIRPLVSLSFIPLSHSTDRMRVYETLLNGGRVAFVSYDHRNWLDHELATGAERFELLHRASVRSETDNGVGQMLADVWRLRPTVFIAPPRVWKGLEFLLKEQIHTAAAERAGDAAEAQTIRSWRRGPFARIMTCATGGGPTDKSSFDFVRKVAGVPLVESYGATECGGIAMAVSGEHRAFMDVMIGDGVVVELLDERTGEPIDVLKRAAVAAASDGVVGDDLFLLRGEALVHTEHVAPGYLRNAEATRGTIFRRNGGKLYFRSGDIVEAKARRSDGVVVAVRVLDRRKNMLERLPLFDLATATDEQPPTTSWQRAADQATTTASAEALEATATRMPGAMHAAAIERPAKGDYVIVVSVPSATAATPTATLGPRPRRATDAEMQLFAALTQESSEATATSANRWRFPMPAELIIDEGAQWSMNASKRKDGLLTVSSKVNRAAVARVFGLK